MDHNCTLHRVSVMLSTAPGHDHGFKVSVMDYKAKRCTSLFKTENNRRVAFDKLGVPEQIVDTYGLCYFKAWAGNPDQVETVIGEMQERITKRIMERQDILKEMGRRIHLPGTRTQGTYEAD